MNCTGVHLTGSEAGGLLPRVEDGHEVLPRLNEGLGTLLLQFHSQPRHVNPVLSKGRQGRLAGTA